MAAVALVDLDGVLVDFVGGALTFYGVDPGARASVGYRLHEDLGMAEAEFWTPLDYSFWAGLDWTREGRELLEGVEDIFGAGNVALMTSPAHTPGCVEGKVDWIKRNLPRYARRFFVGPQKHMVAGPGKLLVDDYDVNVDQFERHGGRGVLVPRPWNYRSDEVDRAGRFSVGSLLGEIESIMGV